MGIAAFYAEKISPLLGATSFGRRLDMAAIAFNADLQFAASEYSDSGGRIFTDAELEEIFSGLDPASLALAKKFMRRQYRCPRNGFMVHPKYFTMTRKSPSTGKSRPNSGGSGVGCICPFPSDRSRSTTITGCGSLRIS